MILREHDSRLEALLSEEGASLQAAPLPDALDEAVRAGLRRSRRGARTRSRRAALVMASTVLVVTLLVGMVRVSPAFASVVSGLPGLSGIVALVAGDKGLEGAVRNDFVQAVNASDSHDGVTFTVNGIIADDTRLNVFYTVKLPSAMKDVPYAELRVYDAESGKYLPASIGFTNPGTPRASQTEFQERMDVSLSAAAVMPDQARLNFKLQGFPKDTEWNVIVPIDKARFAGMKEVIPLDKTIDLQGEKITFGQAVIHPTSLTVDVKFDEANTKKIIWLGDVSIVTDKGEVLRSQGSNGIDGTGMTLVFESDFFNRPKHLTLKGTRIMALDKSKLELKLDLAQGELVQAPDDQVRFISAKKTATGDYTVKLGVKTNVDRDHYSFSIVDGEFHDAAGTKFQIGGFRTSTTAGEDEVITSFEAKIDKPFQNPLTFAITDYPAWIEQPFEVKLK